MKNGKSHANHDNFNLFTQSDDSLTIKNVESY